MLAVALVAFAGCTEKSPEPEAAGSVPESGSEEEFPRETTVNASCEEEYTKFTICPADEIKPKLD